MLLIGIPNIRGGVFNYVKAYIDVLRKMPVNAKVLEISSVNNKLNVRSLDKYDHLICIFIGWEETLRYMSLLSLCHSVQILELGQVIATPESLAPFVLGDILEYKLSLKAINFYKMLSRLMKSSGVKYNIIVLSSIVKDFLSSSVPSENIVVLPPPVKLPSLRELAIGKSMRRQYILDISRFTPRKRLEEVILVSHKLKTRHKTFILGYKQRNYSNLYYIYLTWLCKLLASQSVYLIPNASRKIKKALLLQSKVFLHLRPLGSFEIAVAEAMSYGVVPVVRYGSTAWREVLDKGKYGFSCKNIVECTEIVEQILTDKTLWEEESFRAYLRAKEFDYENFKLKAMSIIKSLIDMR
ncbi:glycosyltransferase [Aeropyrum pernix]|uniref:glycosyltransferase n=1 Tax=Aeropyrum pernix TaxID=56636 RepID=UPI0013F1589A|nr:glycosyltransferase [Aeropyrum pernix]